MPGGCPGGMLKLRFDWYITSNVNMKALNERIKTYQAQPEPIEARIDSQ